MFSFVQLVFPKIYIDFTMHNTIRCDDRGQHSSAIQYINQPFLFVITNNFVLQKNTLKVRVIVVKMLIYIESIVFSINKLPFWN